MSSTTPSSATTITSSCASASAITTAEGTAGAARLASPRARRRWCAVHHHVGHRILTTRAPPPDSQSPARLAANTTETRTWARHPIHSLPSSTSSIGMTSTSSASSSSPASSWRPQPQPKALLALRRRRAETSLLSFGELLPPRGCAAVGALDGPLVPTSSSRSANRTRRPRRDCRGSQSVAGSSPVRAHCSTSLYLSPSAFSPPAQVRRLPGLGRLRIDFHRHRAAAVILCVFFATHQALTPHAVDVRYRPGPASSTRRRHRGALLGLTLSFTVARSAATW